MRHVVSAVPAQLRKTAGRSLERGRRAATVDCGGHHCGRSPGRARHHDLTSSLLATKGVAMSDLSGNARSGGPRRPGPPSGGHPPLEPACRGPSIGPGSTPEADREENGTGADHAFWRARLAPYARAHDGRATVAVLTSVVPYLALSVAMYLVLEVSACWRSRSRFRRRSSWCGRSSSSTTARMARSWRAGAQTPGSGTSSGCSCTPVRALAPRPRGPSRFLGRPRATRGGRRAHAHGRRIPTRSPGAARLGYRLIAQPARDVRARARWSRS